MLLTDAVNQLLSGESNLDDMLVRREVESVVEAIDCTGHDESPGDRAVLRLADVLAEGVSSIKWRNLRIIFPAISCTNYRTHQSKKSAQVILVIFELTMGVDRVLINYSEDIARCDHCCLTLLCHSKMK